jgi:F0F1-type ATP synthase gamma subunit
MISVDEETAQKTTVGVITTNQGVQGFYINKALKENGVFFSEQIEILHDKKQKILVIKYGEKAAEDKDQAGA